VVPPPNNPLALLEHAANVLKAAVKSPKSAALPVDVIVMYEMTFV
jgi:hypothetical protein